MGNGITRREILVKALATAALSAGMGAAWIAEEKKREQEPVNQLRQLSLVPVDPGAPFSLKTFDDRPLVVNFWATWCAPCIEELPRLDAFAKSNPKVSVIGIAVDQQEAVQRFLRQHPLRFAVGLANIDSLSIARVLGNDAGGLPFTVAISKQNAVFYRRIGSLRAEDFEQLGKLSS